jgi:two-component system, NarL family, sensor kinase
LDDLGLVGALKQLFLAYENETMRFVVDVAEPLPQLPAAVETAAFRIAQEAITNVVRHAPHATLCQLRLVIDDDALVVAIVDDGPGIPAGARSGVGLQSMQERAAELNGRCIIQPNPTGGTIIEARLPLAGDR